MASKAVIEEKTKIVNEIVDNIKDSSTFVLFEYQGLSVADMTKLRRALKESGSDLKIYKNTLTKRALNSLDINLDDELVGPKAIAFGKDTVAPIKALNDFAKDHEALQMKVGMIDGEVADLAMLKKYASIPSRDTLLTMFATGLISPLRDFAICVDLHRKNLEENN